MSIASVMSGIGTDTGEFVVGSSYNAVLDEVNAVNTPEEEGLLEPDKIFESQLQGSAVSVFDPSQEERAPEDDPAEGRYEKLLYESVGKQLIDSEIKRLTRKDLSDTFLLLERSRNYLMEKGNKFLSNKASFPEDEGDEILRGIGAYAAMLNLFSAYVRSLSDGDAELQELSEMIDEWIERGFVRKDQKE